MFEFEPQHDDIDGCQWINIGASNTNKDKCNS